jgi:hypothetical protein
MARRLTALALLCLSFGAPAAAQIEVAEATITELQAAMTAGLVSCCGKQIDPVKSIKCTVCGSEECNAQRQQ